MHVCHVAPRNHSLYNEVQTYHNHLKGRLDTIYVTDIDFVHRDILYKEVDFVTLNSRQFSASPTTK